MDKKRFYNVDFLRFIFCISILLLHFSGMMLGPLSGKIPVFKELISSYKLGYISVDFFFIMSGFFWYLSKDKTKDIIKFAIDKYKRFIPVMLWGILLFGLCALLGFAKFKTVYNIEALFLLHGIGITHNARSQGLGNLHPTWYVSTLFWVLILFQYIYSNFNKKIFNLFIAIAIVLGYGLITQEQNGILGGRIATTYYGIYNLGIIRGICGVGIGYFIGNIYTYIQNNKSLEKITNLKCMFLSLIQLSCLSIIFTSLFIKPLEKNNDIFFILLFTIAFLNLLINKDLISKFLNNKFLGKLGIYSYSIYVMHALVLDIFKAKVFCRSNIAILKTQGVELFWLSIISSIILGIITHHLIEKPAVKFFKNMNFLKNSGGGGTLA